MDVKVKVVCVVTGELGGSADSRNSICDQCKDTVQDSGVGAELSSL